MQKEQSAYVEQLISQEPADILKHLHEYSRREDILSVMEHTGSTDDLSERQLKGLLSLPNAMDAIYKEYQKQPANYLKDIDDVISDLAEKKADQFFPLKTTEATPEPTLDQKREEIKAFLSENWESKEAQKFYQKVLRTDGNDQEKVSRLYQEMQDLKARATGKTVDHLGKPSPSIEER